MEPLTPKVSPRRFSLRDFKSGQFWELEVQDSRLFVRSGPLGGKIATKELRCASAEAAAEQAAKLVTKAIGTRVSASGRDFEEDEEVTVYQYEFGEPYLEVGCKGSRAMLRLYDDSDGETQRRETLWARFETPRAATAAETRIRKLLDQATDAKRMPELSAAAALFASDTVERPSCGECARLAEEGLEPPSLSSHSTGLTFTEYSTPVIVAGPLVTAGVRTQVLRELCERVDAFAKKHGEQVVLIAKSPPTWPPDGTIGRALVLGRLVAVGDHHGLTPLSIADLRKGLREAQALPWAELLPLLSDRRLKSPRGLEWECDAEPDDEVQLRVFATGPMASGLVGFGVPRGDGKPGQRGLEELWGQDMDQKRQPRVVAGEAVGVCDFHDDVGPATLDVSARAHKARTAKLGPLAKKAAYYLLGRYD